MFSCLKLIAVLASRKKSSMAPEFKVETLGALIAISRFEFPLLPIAATATPASPAPAEGEGSLRIPLKKKNFC